jgi:diketogulonate reductase-like aldo/keto reductase
MIPELDPKEYQHEELAKFCKEHGFQLRVYVPREGDSGELITLHADRAKGRGYYVRYPMPDMIDKSTGVKGPASRAAERAIREAIERDPR